MIKSVKRLLLIALSAIMVISLLNFVATTVKADSEPVITNENFYVSGAELKIADGEVADEKDHNGLRFTAVLEKSAAQIAYANISDITEMGILVIPNSLLSGELDLTTEKAEKATFTFDELGEVTIGEKDYYQMKAYIWNIPSSFYVKNFTARAYISTAESTVYSGELTRSIAFVANAAVSDEDVDADIKTLAEAYIPTYTVIFDVDGGNAIANASVKYGAEVTAVAEKTGYRFDGWTLNGNDFDTASLTLESDSLEITLKAKYTRMLGQDDASNFKSIIESDMAGKYALSGDIDMTGVTFTSIGTYDSVPFTGIFDGEGHAIKNLTVSEDTTETSYGKGTVFAMNNGTIQNLFVEFTTPSIAQFSGFVGYNGARVLNVAAVMNATASCSYGNWFNGVVVARNQGGAAVVRNCFGELKGLSGSQWCGTVVGYNYSNNYGLTNLIGIANGTTTPSDAAYGCQGTPLFTCSYNQQDNEAFRPDANSKLFDTVIDFINSGFEFDSAKGWASYWKLEDGKFSFGENVIAEDKTIYLEQEDAANLQSIIESNMNGVFVLKEDIDMTGITFKSIGGVDSGSDIKQFTGSIDGKGFAIKNLTITARSAKDQYSVYLAGASNFIANNGGIVKNIAFVNLTMADRSNFVGVIGQNFGTVNNVYADITLTGNMTSMAQMNGGIVARFDGGSVKNCIVNINASGLTGNQVFGTVVGNNYSGAEYPIANCYAITNGLAVSYNGGATVLYYVSYDSNTRRPKDCANYETADALLTAVTELPSANGWANYWKIENNTLYFGNNVIGAIA